MLKTNEIYLGDCLNLMKEMPDDSVDLVLTDPPYDEKTHAGCVTKGRIKNTNKSLREIGSLNFESIDNYDFVSEFLRITTRWIIMFCPVEALGQIKTYYPEEYIRGCFWDKISPSPQFSGDRPA